MHSSEIQKLIEIRAYEIWETENCPQGNDLAHWLRAEAEILGLPENPATAAEPSHTGGEDPESLLLAVDAAE